MTLQLFWDFDVMDVKLFKHNIDIMTLSAVVSYFVSARKYLLNDWFESKLIVLYCRFINLFNLFWVMIDFLNNLVFSWHVELIAQYTQHIAKKLHWIVLLRKKLVCQTRSSKYFFKQQHLLSSERHKVINFSTFQT